jgi:dipeptidyl-peptidase-4
MKKKLMIIVSMFLSVFPVMGINKLELKDITSGAFSADYLSEVTPLDNDVYAQISKDSKQILTYSFKTGKLLNVLFDVNNTVGEKIQDFDNYKMSPDGKRILIQTNTKAVYRRSFKATFYIYTIASRKLEQLSSNGPQQTPIWSSDGTEIAFVRDNNIFLVKLLYDNSESQVTTDGEFNKIINGIPDWVNEEEFGFNNAMTFNADGTMICWIKYDESAVKTYSLQLFKGYSPERKEYSDYPGEYSYKYPKAGQDNSIVTAWSYDIKSHKIRQIDLPLTKEDYIPRIKTSDDPMKIYLYTMNRHQDVLNIYSANPRSTVCQQIIKESVPKYVKEEAMEGIIFTSKHILLPSDRDGHMHLYLYNNNGQLLRQVSKGNFDVTKVYGYDEETGDIYYQADAVNPMNREIYVNHKNGKTENITSKEGFNDAIFSKDFKYLINIWSDRNTPYTFNILSNNGKTLASLIDNKELKGKLDGYNLPQKEMFSFTTSEGVQLNGWMIKPMNFDSNKKYPVIMCQYSGPGSQQVINSWSIGSMGQGGLYDYYLCQNGFIVACVDGRGTGGRGADFEKCTYLNLGDLESKDQVEAAVWLGKQSFVDKDNIGIWGWSYGGFNTLMSMSEGRPVFKAGVAVAPPTNWKYYDSVYTERFMRTPKENASGYEVNPINRVNNLHGALLICHGVADDNVHPQNTFEYADALVNADKDFKEVYYTNRNHSIRGGNSRNHLLRQIANFFESELK